MTLVITLLAAAIATVVWYAVGSKSPMKIGVLALMYWGAALRWVVDGLACLVEGEAFIEIAQTDEGKQIISVFSQVGYTWGKDSDYDGERDAQAMLKSAGK